VLLLLLKSILNIAQMLLHSPNAQQGVRDEAREEYPSERSKQLNVFVRRLIHPLFSQTGH
jgi:hypothetical protein